MLSTSYHPGGLKSAAPAQNKEAEADSVAGTFTRWAADGALLEQRALTPAEVTAFVEREGEVARMSNRTTIDAGITAALAQLDALIAAPAVATVPTGTLTTAQLSDGLRTMRTAVQQNRAGAQDIARVLKQTIRLVRGDFDGVD